MHNHDLHQQKKQEKIPLQQCEDKPGHQDLNPHITNFSFFSHCPIFAILNYFLMQMGMVQKISELVEEYFLKISRDKTIALAANFQKNSSLNP